METPTDTRNWRQVIEEAEKRGYATPEEVARAKNYRTCPVGLVPNERRHPRDGSLGDSRPYLLSIDFYWAFARNDFSKASHYLKRIHMEMGVRP